ncbi:putative uncharacterized protein [Prevotella sp. CAG:1058]|nr:putative uncharacterized protein [Prevotella sp. CAG:1058]
MYFWKMNINNIKSDKFINNYTMRNNCILSFAVLLAMVVFFVSCEKYTADEEFDLSEANSTLVVRTCLAPNEAGLDESATISYPVNVFVFNEKGACVGVSVIGSEAENLSLKLPEGSYNIYAIAGADDKSYNIPTKENATKKSPIILKDGSKHGDLMSAYSNVELANGEENTLTLSLERKVMMIESVSMTNIPDDVTAVSVSVSPLYEELLLDGSYLGENGVSTINLDKDVDGTWKNNSEVYLLEAADNATLKVSLTRGDGVHSYSYSCAEELKANYKIHINGTYGGDGIKVSGTITGATWAGQIDVDFTFYNGEVTPPSEGNVDVDAEVKGNAPEVGTLYNDCYVLKSDNSSNNTVVTLMSTCYWEKLEFVEGNQESLKEAIDAAFSKFTVEGIDSWRLPTLDELRYIKEHIEEINQKLNENDKDIFNIDFYGVYSYYFLDEDGLIKVYCPYRDEIEDSPNSGLASYVLRAFSTVEFVE